jgi:hypothetical protein
MPRKERIQVPTGATAQKESGGKAWNGAEGENVVILFKNDKSPSIPYFGSINHHGQWGRFFLFGHGVL